jgi:hypothetical protein
MPRSVTVSLSRACLDLLPGEVEVEPGRGLVAAIAYFLAERSSGEAGHAYPDFRRDGAREPGRQLDDAGEPHASFALTVGDDLWRRFEAEAERQGVSTDRLLEHAALFLAAQADAGKLAERIAGELAEEG